MCFPIYIVLWPDVICRNISCSIGVIELVLPNPFYEDIVKKMIGHVMVILTYCMSYSNNHTLEFIYLLASLKP